MTQDRVRLDVSSILRDEGYTEASNQFDFDQQPSTHIDRVFRVRLNRTGTVPELGLGQIEIHRLECWVARQNGGRDPIDACRSLTVDIGRLEARIQQFALRGERFNVSDDSPETDIQQPSGDYVVGMLALDIDFDRDLAEV